MGAATAYGCGDGVCGLAATSGSLESSLLWGGAACGAIQCPDACSGHGACELQADGRPACVCEPGWELDNCSDNAGARALQLHSHAVAAAALCAAAPRTAVGRGNPALPWTALRLDAPPCRSA